MTLIRPATVSTTKAMTRSCSSWLERRAFAGRADRAEAIGAGRDLELDLVAKCVVVDLPVRKRGNHRHRKAGKRLSLCLHALRPRSHVFGRPNCPPGGMIGSAEGAGNRRQPGLNRPLPKYAVFDGRFDLPPETFSPCQQNPLAAGGVYSQWGRAGDFPRRPPGSNLIWSVASFVRFTLGRLARSRSSSCWSSSASSAC